MYDRITINPNQMRGEPCIRNLRIPIATIITMIAQGITPDKILEYYPDLEKDDITEALNFTVQAGADY